MGGICGFVPKLGYSLRSGRDRKGTTEGLNRIVGGLPSYLIYMAFVTMVSTGQPRYLVFSTCMPPLDADIAERKVRSRFGLNY